MESDLYDNVYWTYARRELSLKIQLRLGEQNALLLSHHNSFVMIINAALGGESKNGSAPAPGQAGVKDIGAGHATAEDAAAAINRAMAF